MSLVYYVQYNTQGKRIWTITICLGQPHNHLLPQMSFNLFITGQCIRIANAFQNYCRNNSRKNLKNIISRMGLQTMESGIFGGDF